MSRWGAISWRAHNLQIQAARYYVAERSNDLPADEMRDQLVAAAGSPAAVDAALAALASDATALERTPHELLQSAWDERGESEQVRSVIDDAKSALPVIETAIVAMVAMYGMYLMVTGGKKSEVIGKEGTRKTEWYPPALSNLVDLFRDDRKN